jgi:hypothetical protein
VPGALQCPRARLLALCDAGTWGGGVSSQAKGAITVSDIQINNFAAGIASPFARVTLTGVKIQDVVIGIDARRIDVDAVTIIGVPGSSCITGTRGRVRGNDLELTCDTGIAVARAVSLTRLTNWGVLLGVMTTGRITLIDSSVTGATLADIVSSRMPRLTGTTCDRSARIDANVITSTTWGVCAND